MPIRFVSGDLFDNEHDARALLATARKPIGWDGFAALMPGSRLFV